MGDAGGRRRWVERGRRMLLWDTLVDLLEKPDQMTAGNAQLNRGPAPVSTVPGQRREDLLALQHVHLAAQAAGRVTLRRDGSARVEDRHERRAVQKLLPARAE